MDRGILRTRHRIEFGQVHTESDRDVASSHVYVGGIASEYCVKETVLSLLQSGRSVTLLVPGLGWVAEEDHKKALAELKGLGALLVEA